MKLYFDQPALLWQEGFPIGNGRLGAVVYGDGKHKILQINEDTNWSGYPARTQKGFTPEELAEVKALVRQKRYAEAMHRIEKRTMEAEDVQMYLPFGDLLLEMDQTGITEYRRELDLETAVVKETYRQDGAVFVHSCFISAPAQVLVYHIEAEKPFDIKLSADGFYLNRKEYDKNGFRLYGQCPGRNNVTVGGTDNRKAVSISDDPAKKGMTYQGRGTLLTEHGIVNTDETGIFCREITALTLVFSARSSYNGLDKHPYLEGVDPSIALNEDLKAANAAYEVLLAEHIRDHQRYFSRVSFKLKESGREEMDLGKRLALFAQDGEPCTAAV